MSNFYSTKVFELGSCTFRQPQASNSNCRFIHGYNLTAKYWFGSKELDDNNWVVDFGGLQELRDVLRNQFDHTTCIAADDPVLGVFEQLAQADACDLRVMPNGTGIERIAEFCAGVGDELVRRITNDRCWVERVEVWEQYKHDDNSACYINDRREDEHMTSKDAPLSEPLEEAPPKPDPTPTPEPPPEDPTRNPKAADDPRNHNWNFGTKWI